MVSGSSSVVTSDCKNVLLDRGFKTSPSFTAYVSGSIGTSSGAAVVSDTALGAVVSNWNGGSDFKGFQANFPSFDTANNKVTTRVFVTSTQANSNKLVEYADFNGDAGAPKIGGRFVYNEISKTSSIQIFFTPSYKIK